MARVPDREAAAGDEIDRPLLEHALTAASERHQRVKENPLDLDLTRGKPSSEQLDLSMPLLDLLGRHTRARGGVDCRNYGVLEGLAEARELFAPILGVEPGELWVQDNSSLRLMHDLLSWCLFLGPPGHRPWRDDGPVRFLCPVPGYDRHFQLCAHLGIEMETVPLDENGPDMDLVQRRVAEDPTLRGMFCVPRFSNPTGAVYSPDVVARLATMGTAAPDFRIFWDNAYACHALHERAAALDPLLETSKAAGTEDRILTFGSTSKISLASAGLAFVAVAGANAAWLRDNLSKQTIGPNKIIQLAHVEFFGNPTKIEQHMEQHARLLRPRFAAVLETLDSRLRGLGVARWTEPGGGYFISLDTIPGCAKRVVAMAAEAGVKITAAGATFPHGHDPRDSNLRFAPSFPSLEEVRMCAEVVADCIVLASAESR